MRRSRLGVLKILYQEVKISMIDIHTHILPGLDDGAANWNDTLNMARAAYRRELQPSLQLRITQMEHILTTADEVVEHTCINEQLIAAGVPVTISDRTRDSVHDDLLEAWDRRELLPLAASSYVLIEMPSSRIPESDD